MAGRCHSEEKKKRNKRKKEKRKKKKKRKKEEKKKKKGKGKGKGDESLVSEKNIGGKKGVEGRLGKQDSFEIVGCFRESSLQQQQHME
jgi:hypothetical protein